MTTHAERMAAIPLKELVGDRWDAEQDIGVCRIVLSSGITTYGDGHSIQKRIETNQRTIAVIDAELERRKNEASDD